MSQRPVNEAHVCQNCAFFFDSGYGGECRRHAPVVTAERMAKQWPWMRGADWCGDFQARPGEQGKR